MKSCELCKSTAKVYCDSDQASLCWTCDSKVHSANFLVARHSRSLLCRVCQSPTPWTASGDKIGPSAVSVCEKCVVNGASEGDDRRESSQVGNHASAIAAAEDGDNDDEDEYDGDEDGETELDVEDEEDGEDNQVVPLCYTPPPAVSSSSEDFSTGDRAVYLKRKRYNVADLSEDDCLSLKKYHRGVPVTPSGEAIEGNGGTLYHFLPLTSEAMGEKLKTVETVSGENSSGAVTGVCKRTRNVGLDLNSSDS